LTSSPRPSPPFGEERETEPVSSCASSNATPAPQFEVLPAPRCVRHGKIARLPYLERDMVNRMLRNNITYAKIREALREHGIRVTERNVSNWKTRGGYEDWCREQDRAVEIRLLQDNLAEHLRRNDATMLPEVGLQLAATNLSQYFLRSETQRQLASDPEKNSRAISILCRLARQIHHLQKYRDDSARELGGACNPERLKREAEKEVELTRNVYSAARLGETVNEPDTPHRNYVPRNIS
jgi:hypothetical protein